MADRSALDRMAISAVVIAGVVEAAQAALSGAPDLRHAYPVLNLANWWNYVPLGCVTAAGILWLTQAIRNMLTRPGEKRELLLENNGRISLIPARRQPPTTNAQTEVAEAYLADNKQSVPPILEPRHYLPDNADIEKIKKTWEGLTDFQADKLRKLYVGKWLRKDIVVRDIIDANHCILLRAHFADHLSERPLFTTVVASFGKEWEPRLSDLQNGDKIKVSARIKGFQDQLLLDTAELI